MSPVKDLPLCRIVYEYSGTQFVVNEASILNVGLAAVDAYQELIKNEVSKEDLSKIRHIVLAWVADMVLNQELNEDALQPGHWDEYRASWRLPRYAFKAILHIVHRAAA